MNKRIYLVGPSALSYLRQYSAYARREYRENPLSHRLPSELRRPHASRVKTFVNPCTSAREIRRAGLCDADEPVAWKDASDSPAGFCPLPLSSPLHVLVPDHGNNRRAKDLVKHAWTGEFPPGSFWKAGTADAQYFQGSSEPYDVYVAGPELVFVQMAKEHSKLTEKEAGGAARHVAHISALADTLMVGMELCGTYVMPGGWNADAVYRRRPLTSVAKLVAYYDKLPARQRCKLAQEALRYLVDDSASPMETALYLLSCLPKRYGGYALPKPVANHAITVSERFRELAHRSYYVPDLFYASEHLDLEYDSDAFHDTYDSITDRALRDNALHIMGVTVLSVTWDIISRADRFEKVIHQAYRVLKLKWHATTRSEEANRRSLRACVLPPVFFW